MSWCLDTRSIFDFILGWSSYIHDKVDWKHMLESIFEEMHFWNLMDWFGLIVVFFFFLSTLIVRVSYNGHAWVRVAGFRPLY
jgi:uncharacterized membrane protein